MKDKHAVVDDQLKETPERSDRWLAHDLGMDEKTVAGRRRKLAGVDPEIPNRDALDFALLPQKVRERPTSRYKSGRSRVHQLRKTMDDELARKAPLLHKMLDTDIPEDALLDIR